MPFKLKLKRTRRYEISTKNQFMVGVVLLDNTFIECTLSSESTGRECLESIAQRMELAETCYFGLRYVTKKLLFHWIELDKPLKKQLEKYAQHTGQHMFCLYFGVMYYVMGAHKIQDDITRFHYYLQLKNDLVEGKLHCSMEQAIRLGAYSLQAEYGDYDHDKLSVEALKESPVLPRKMVKDGDMQVLEALVNTYISLIGTHPVLAEIQYIKEVQLMDSYGTEYFLAKDGSQKELYLGISHVGIFARYLNVEAEQVVFFRWNEIARLNQNKKMFEIDTSKSSVQYQMEDTDTAKYVCKMCQRALKFYRSPKSNLSSSIPDISVENPLTENLVYQEAPQVVLPPSDSSDLTESQSSLIYGQDHKTSQEMQHQVAMSEEQYRNSQQSLDTASQEFLAHSQGSEGSLLLNNGGVYHTPGLPPGPQHHDPYYANRLALLPAYRPSPDYDAVMRQRMAQQPAITSSQGLGTSQVYTHSQTTAYSQPEIRQHLPTYPSETQYVNAAAIRNYSHSVYASTFHEGHSHFGGGRGGSERGTHNLAVHPTYSSPELNTQGLTEQFHSTDNVLPETLAYPFRPPPPYPRASSSTPDLAVQTGGAPTSSDAPDLLPQSHPASNPGLTVQSRLDKSVENLHEVVPQSPHLPPHMTTTDQDDTSSEHSYATFHAKESDDSSEEDTLRKKAQAEDSTRSQIQIRFMGPKEAPPPSKTKEVATLRESFRRMMIARAGSLNRGKVQNPVMQRAITGISPEAKLAGLDSSLPLTRVEEHVNSSLPSSKLPTPAVPPTEHVMPLDVIPPPPPYPSHLAETGGMVVDVCDEVGGQVMMETRESDSDSIHCLDMSQLPTDRSSGQGQGQPDVTLTSDRLPQAGEEEALEEESELDKSNPGQPHLGPLKLAAMNGLSLSRPFMFAFMNDESRAPKDDRRKMLESKISEGQVFSEFEDIPKKVTGLDCSVARMECNESRNRFRDILPYDISRVKLTPRKDNPEGYINASHIKLNAADMEWWFVATQAPLQSTVQDFWQMIWEQDVEVVAMLTAIAELGKPKCYPYWPQEAGPEHKQVFGDFEVELEFTDDSLCYITSRILVRHRSSNNCRQIWHLQYTDWPDHGCPEDIYGFLGFLDEIESVRRLAESEEGSGRKAPVVVHCSAGVGRTGVVILTMVMKWCLEHNNSVDLPRALHGIRKQRMHMVQTVGQYQFIHNTLIQYLKNTRLI